MYKYYEIWYKNEFGITYLYGVYNTYKHAIKAIKKDHNILNLNRVRLNKVISETVEIKL